MKMEKAGLKTEAVKTGGRDDKDSISQKGVKKQKLLITGVPCGEKWRGLWTLGHCVGPSHKEHDLGLKDEADQKELPAQSFQLTPSFQVLS